MLYITSFILYQQYQFDLLTVQSMIYNILRIVNVTTKSLRLVYFLIINISLINIHIQFIGSFRKHCNICKQPYVELHRFYHQLCLRYTNIYYLLFVDLLGVEISIWKKDFKRVNYRVIIVLSLDVG